ncbi:MAG: hypothetical protein AB1714_00875 [Acidobacteriota bacterium]
MKPINWRAAALNLAVLLVSCFVCLAATEVFLRRWFPIQGLVYQLDPRCIYRLIPNARKTVWVDTDEGRSRVLLTINSSGYRGPELGSGPPPRRVLVYGDSFIEAEYTRTEETFAWRLQEKLSAGLQSPVEVINAGVAGYGPDQISVRMQDEIGSLKPSVVVVSIYVGNDFGDLLRNKLYRLDDSGRMVENSWKVDSSLERDFEGARRRSDLQVVRGAQLVARMLSSGEGSARTLDPDVLARNHIEHSLRRCAEDYEDFVVGGNDKVFAIFRDAYDADVSLFPTSDSARYKVRLMAQVLGRIKRISDDNSVPLLLMIIPSPIDVCKTYETRVKRRVYENYRPTRLTTLTEDLAKRHGIDTLNLYDPYAASNPDSLYFRHGNDHWNSAGQDLAADLAAKRILADGLIR